MVNQRIEIDMFKTNAAHGARHLRVLVGEPFCIAASLMLGLKETSLWAWIDLFL